jgi:3-oxoadipate enol-lactonase
MPTTTNGMHYEVSGDGPVTLLMLPGLGCSIEAWAQVTPLLDGYRCVVMDLPGHAGSLGADADGSSLATISAPVLAACDEIGLDKFVVVGLSFGAAIGVRVTLDLADRVIGYLGFMPWPASGTERDDPFMQQMHDSYADVDAIDRAIQTISLDTSRTTDAARTMKNAVSERFWRSWYGTGVYTSIGDELGAIAVPAGYVLGGRDVVAPQARLIDEMRAVPGGRVMLLADAGHLAPYELPETTAAEIRDFVERQVLIASPPAPRGDGPRKVAELGHVGIRCFDVDAQLAFYTEVLGLVVTDHDPTLGNYFLSARPDDEHHELLLAKGRDVPLGAKLIQQISFRCDTFDDVVGLHRQLQEYGVTFDMIVSHGNAVGVYFFDPEGNRAEVYWQTGLVARQPFIEHIDIETPAGELMDAIRASVEKYGADGFTEESYLRWTREQAVQASQHETTEVGR